MADVGLLIRGHLAIEVEKQLPWKKLKDVL